MLKARGTASLVDRKLFFSVGMLRPLVPGGRWLGPDGSAPERHSTPTHAAVAAHPESQLLRDITPTRQKAQETLKLPRFNALRGERSHDAMMQGGHPAGIRGAGQVPLPGVNLYPIDPSGPLLLCVIWEHLFSNNFEV